MPQKSFLKATSAVRLGHYRFFLRRGQGSTPWMPIIYISIITIRQANIYNNNRTSSHAEVVGHHQIWWAHTALLSYSHSSNHIGSLQHPQCPVSTSSTSTCDRHQPPLVQYELSTIKTSLTKHLSKQPWGLFRLTLPELLCIISLCCFPNAGGT